MKIAGQNIDRSAVLLRLILFSLVWWSLSGGTLASWIIGAPAVFCALIASVVLTPSVNFVWWRLVTFIPFFLWQSLKGGIEVALVALRPTMPLSPKLIDYPIQLPLGMAQVAMINITSLLPGTLSAELNGNILTVHVFDSQSDYLGGLQALEQRLSRIFPTTAEYTLREDS